MPDLAHETPSKCFFIDHACNLNSASACICGESDPHQRRLPASQQRLRRRRRDRNEYVVPRRQILAKASPSTFHPSCPDHNFASMNGHVAGFGGRATTVQVSACR